MSSVPLAAWFTAPSGILLKRAVPEGGGLSFCLVIAYNQLVGVIGAREGPLSDQRKRTFQDARFLDGRFIQIVPKQAELAGGDRTCLTPLAADRTFRAWKSLSP